MEFPIWEITISISEMRRSKPNPFKSKPQIAFVVDGECESWYIQMLQRNEESIKVRLSPEIPQRKKLSDQYNRVLELSKEYYKVFWMIDFDVIKRETKVAKKGSKTALQELRSYCENLKKKNYKDKVTVIINNPCLEFWLLQHFETTSRYFDDCDSATKQLKKHLTDYNKSQAYYTKQDNDIYLKLKPNLPTAIVNANKLGEFDFDNPDTGMSQVQLLFELDELKGIF